MAVRTYRPQCRIELGKNIRREGPGATWGSGDISELLGEGGEVSVHKGIYEPMGSFVITFPDQPAVNLDTVYAAVEPMDHITIRLARSPQDYADGELPVVMRGFVRQVRRAETMGDDGKPRRLVIVSGNDYGVIFNNFRIVHRRRFDIIEAVLSSFSMYVQFPGLGGEGALSAREFYTRWVQIVNEHYIASIGGNVDSATVYAINTDLSVAEGWILMVGIQTFEGPVWNLMVRHADTPWNELFVEDRADGPALVYRPAPWLSIDDQPIGDATYPNATVIDAVEVKKLDVARSDRDVANIYWVDSQASALHGNIIPLFDNANEPDVVLEDHPNSTPDLYGLRMMNMTTTQMGGTNRPPAQPAHQKPAVQEQIELDIVAWIRARRQRLIDMNQDNVEFENGNAVLKGNERIRPGEYAVFRRGGFGSRFYVTAVDHSFAPFSHFTTSCRLIRGDGFHQRLKVEQSPYWLEGREGVYE